MFVARVIRSALQALAAAARWQQLVCSIPATWLVLCSPSPKTPDALAVDASTVADPMAQLLPAEVVSAAVTPLLLLPALGGVPIC